ncbi:MAG: CAP domain-containing protein [bacterium]|nr:CAP domain-containing protein [bacterium]
MLKKLPIIFVGLLTIASVGLLLYPFFREIDEPQNVTQGVSKKVIPAQTPPKKVVAKTTAPVKSNTTVVQKAVSTEKEVVAPGPLRATTPPQSNSALTVSGIIEHTNIERAQNGGLSPLTENYLLDRDAQMKVDDMFAKQYFEHVSPSGVGPSDLAQAVGYGYVVVGENLALGDFNGDLGVVTAWMNSPGHRANILKPQYREIGVAVGRGMYEGRMTWLAVQSFGVPLSACPSSDANLKAQIDANNTSITSMRAALDAKKAQLDSTPTNDPNYNTYVNEYNAMLPDYNSLVETNRANVTTYNAGVQAFNACIAEASGH